MYHATIARDPQDVRVSGGLKTIALVAGGAHGCLLKSWAPSRTWNAETLGCTLEVRTILSESCARFTNLHHSIVGKSLLPMLRPAMKNHLNV